LEPHSRESKFAIGIGAIGLIVTLLLTSFHLSTRWTMISISIIIFGAVFVYFLPRISNVIGVRSPFYLKRTLSKTETMPTIQEPAVIVYNQDDLPPWNELFRKIEDEIMIQGITLESLNHVRTAIETAAKRGKRVRILLCHPETPFIPDIETVVVSTNTKARIQSCVDMMLQTRNTLGSNDIQNLEIKWHKQIPTMSLVIANESMQIEPYPYKTPQDKRKTFRINRKGQMELFDVYRKAFENLWNDANPAQPSTGANRNDE
jgi:hypothetical protein